MCLRLRAHSKFTNTFVALRVRVVVPSSPPSYIGPLHRYPGSQACPATILLRKTHTLQLSMYQQYHV